jgi:hypothetical protein
MSEQRSSWVQGLSHRVSKRFEYCRSLRFEDRPDYAYLKRLSQGTLLQEGFQYDNMFDWTVLNLQQERSRLPPERPLAVEGAGVRRSDSGSDRVVAAADDDVLKPAADAAAEEQERSRSGGNDFAAAPHGTKICRPEQPSHLRFAAAARQAPLNSLQAVNRTCRQDTISQTKIKQIPTKIRAQ